MRAVTAARVAILSEAGWRIGTQLENRIAHILHRYGWRPDEVAQQHRVGNYRLDFAWAEARIGLEADGWHHLRPETAARDRQRDAWLREQGWLMFRVDDGGEDELERQVLRVHHVAQRLCIPWGLA